MPISVTCKCGARLKAPDTAAGKSIRCSACKAVLGVPEMLHASGPPPARAAAPPRGASLAEHDIPEDWQKDLLDELSRDERILWVGRPIPELWGRPNWLVLIIGIVVGILAIAALGLPLLLPLPPDTSGGVRALLWIPTGFLGLMSLVCILNTIFEKRKPQYRPVYLVTNRRVITRVRTAEEDKTTGWFAPKLVKLSRVDSTRVPGAGDLTIDGSPLLEDIADVRKVEKLIRETLLDRMTDKLTE
jgi:hypothetical protein